MRRDSDRERQVRPRYDGMAAWYDSFVRSTEMTRVALDSLGRLLGNGPGRCLDLGCGTGIAFETLAQLGWTLVGVDVSADQLSVAANVASPAAVELVRADAECLPFSDGSFDAVASLLTQTDFDDFEAVAKEAARVLRPGGRFVYVGVHPCFLGPAVERHRNAPHLLHAGYRRRGWTSQGPGFRYGRDGLRGRVGVSQVPLADFLNAFLEVGLRLDRLEEPGDEDYPLLLSVRATRP